MGDIIVRVLGVIGSVVVLSMALLTVLAGWSGATLYLAGFRKRAQELVKATWEEASSDPLQPVSEKRRDAAIAFLETSTMDDLPFAVATYAALAGIDPTEIHQRAPDVRRAQEIELKRLEAALEEGSVDTGLKRGLWSKRRSELNLAWLGLKAFAPPVWRRFVDVLGQTLREARVYLTLLGLVGWAFVVFSRGEDNGWPTFVAGFIEFAAPVAVVWWLARFARPLWEGIAERNRTGARWLLVVIVLHGSALYFIFTYRLTSRALEWIPTPAPPEPSPVDPEVSGWAVALLGVLAGSAVIWLIRRLTISRLHRGVEPASERLRQLAADGLMLMFALLMLSGLLLIGPVPAEEWSAWYSAAPLLTAALSGLAWIGSVIAHAREDYQSTIAMRSHRIDEKYYLPKEARIALSVIGYFVFVFVFVFLVSIPFGDQAVTIDGQVPNISPGAATALLLVLLVVFGLIPWLTYWNWRQNKRRTAERERVMTLRRRQRSDGATE